MTTNREKALEFKKQGNGAFKSKNFEQAIELYTQAIELDPTDHVFYSNRSGCYTSLKKYEEAIQDGNKCIELKADWFKGYNRKAQALETQKKWKEAAEVYSLG